MELHWTVVLVAMVTMGLEVAFCDKDVLTDLPKKNDWPRWKHGDEAGAWIIHNGVYQVCDIYSSSKPNHWLTSDAINLKGAERIEVNIMFTITNCARFKNPKYCSNGFSVYLNTSDSATPQAPHNGYQKIKTVTATKLWDGDSSQVPEETVTLKTEITNKGSHVFLAFHDQGACIALKSVRVLYYFCPSLTAHLVTLPRTISHFSPNSTKVDGSCAYKSVKGDGYDAFALCQSNGQWNISGLMHCVCKEGFTRNGTKCGECPSGTYKEGVGNEKCISCPAKAIENLNRTMCECQDNFYRAPGENQQQPCSAIPSSPFDAEKTFVNASSVEIGWKPGDSGGRSDMYYEITYSVECTDCDDDCKQEKNQLGNTKKPRVLFTQLKFCATYTFLIYAKNGVTETANEISKPLSVSIFSSAGQPVVKIKRFDSTSAKIEWSFKDGYKGVEILIIYYKEEDLSGNKRQNITADAFKRFLIIDNLEPDAGYIFKIQPKNRRGLVPVTLEAKQVKTTVSTTDPSNGANITTYVIAGAVAGAVFVIILDLVLVIFLRRRRNRRDAGKPQGTEMSSFGLYIDPSNYADPLELLKNFAPEIEKGNIKLDAVIGGGEFGDVYKGTLKGPDGSTTVAIKILKQGSSAKNRDDFLFEASIMGQFDHINVIRLEGVVTKTLPMMIITEYMKNGSMQSFLKSCNKKLTHLQLIGMARGVAAGMEYLAGMNFIHRDLAARNILVGEDMSPKVADFGLSRELDDDPESEYQTQGGKIAIRWTAPEALRYHTFSSASDVWSFGIVLWEIMSFAERPYWDWDNFKVMDRVQAGFRMPAPLVCKTNANQPNSSGVHVACPKIIHDVMMRCWEDDKNKRPKFSEIVKNLDELIRSPEMLKDGYSPRKSNAAIDFNEVESVHDWLESIKMQQYVPLFERAGYQDLLQVSALDDTEIRRLGVKRAGHRNNITKSISVMKKHLSSPGLESE